ncbi:MAG: hypothetical protein WBA12_13500 [Catalinimonas sp.]
MRLFTCFLVLISFTAEGQFYREWFRGDNADEENRASPARFKGIFKYYPAQSGEYRGGYERALNNGASVEADAGIIYHGYLLDGLSYETEPAAGVALRLSYRNYPRAKRRRRRTLNGTYRSPLLMYRFVRYNFDSYGYDTEGRDVITERLRLRQHVVGLQYLLGRQVNLLRVFSVAVQYGFGMRVKFANLVTDAGQSRAWLLERTPGATLSSTPTTAVKLAPSLHLNLSVGVIRPKSREERREDRRDQREDRQERRKERREERN